MRHVQPERPAARRRHQHRPLLRPHDHRPRLLLRRYAPPANWSSCPPLSTHLLITHTHIQASAAPTSTRPSRWVWPSRGRCPYSAPSAMFWLSSQVPRLEQPWPATSPPRSSIGACPRALSYQADRLLPFTTRVILLSTKRVGILIISPPRSHRYNGGINYVTPDVSLGGAFLAEVMGAFRLCAQHTDTIFLRFSQPTT